MNSLVLVSAVARNGVIGLNNALPWHLPEDLAFFKKTTLGAPILMGRKTWDSIGRALPGRCNIVLTRDPAWRPSNLPEQIPCVAADHFNARADIKTQVVVCSTVAQALSVSTAQYGTDTPLFVIGGAEIYRSLLPVADALVLTEIDHDFAGDAHFPSWDRAEFRATWQESHHHEGTPSFQYSFVRYERIHPNTCQQEPT